MITISTKDLRQNLAQVLKQVATGERFLLIHRSQPVAEISKNQNITSFNEASDKDIQAAALNDVSEDFLSTQELNYYLSLKWNLEIFG